MRKLRQLMILSCVLVATALPLAMAEAPTTVESAYPGLASGALCQATLGELPEGVLVKAGEIEVTTQSLKDRMAKVSDSMRAQFEKNAFFAVDQIASSELIKAEAKKKVAESGTSASGVPDDELVNAYVKEIAASATATEDEMKAFYEENKGSFGAATLDQVRDQIRPYVLREKQQDVLQQHIRTMGTRVPITVSAVWTKEQAAAALDNPVDKARQSGMPTMVDFGADGCRPCEMMTPIIESLKTKYSGKANILFVHVRQEPVLGSRYGIRAIPVQAFFDKTGKEVFRHVGFFPQDQIEKKLAELGV